MRQLFEQLEEIESANGSKKKKELLAELVKNKNHKAILHMALDPRFPMYLGKGAQFKPFDPETDEQDEISFQVIMRNLNEGFIGRGHKAIEAVSGAIGSFNEIEEDMDNVYNYPLWARKWVPRLVTKDLQIGVSWKTFTDVTKEKKFSVMLAKDINKIKKLEEKFKLPVFVQPKLDGYRAFSNAEGNNELRSRNGKEYKNFPQIVNALEEVCNVHVLLDGEIMSDDFQSMQKTAFRQDGESVGDVRYHVFDIIDRGEWENRLPPRRR